MSAELYSEMLEVLSDAIKILGPALITAWFGYKVGKHQVQVRLHELDKANEYKAREKIFDHYKDKLKKLEKSESSLNETFGKLAGMSSADIDGDLGFSGFIQKYLQLYYDELPYNLESIEMDLYEHGLESKHYSKRLIDFKSLLPNLKPPSKPEEVNDSVIELMRIYSSASVCLRAIVESEASDVFKPYIKNA